MMAMTSAATPVETVVIEPEVVENCYHAHVATQDVGRNGIRMNCVLTGVRVTEWPPGVDRMYLTLGGQRVLLFLRDEWVDLKDLVLGVPPGVPGALGSPGIPLALMKYQTVRFEVPAAKQGTKEVYEEEEDGCEDTYETADGRFVRGVLLKKGTRAVYGGTTPGLVLEFTDPPAGLPNHLSLDILQRVRIPRAELDAYAKLEPRVLPGTERDDDGTVEVYLRNAIRFNGSMAGLHYCVPRLV